MRDKRLRILRCRGYPNRILKMDDRGSASVEASIVLVLFLFVVLFFASVISINEVRSEIYEASVETAEYMAEYAYLTDKYEGIKAIDLPMVYLRFDEYVDDKALLEKYVYGGVIGVSFFGSELPNEDGYIILKVNYRIHIDVPLFSIYSKQYKVEIKQRAYLGRNDYNEDIDDRDSYVYVAKNGTVYHNTRTCTYLLTKVYSENITTAEKNNKPCEYCGKNCGTVVFVTEYGDVYHSTKSCSRLKRTVERKKKSEVGLPGCSKCAD